MANSANAGTVNVGSSAVSSTQGAYLNAGDSFMMPAAPGAASYDLTQVFFSCSNSGDSVLYNYLQ